MSRWFPAMSIVSSNVPPSGVRPLEVQAFRGKAKATCASRQSRPISPLVPRVGFEPTTYRLRSGCSTAELSGRRDRQTSGRGRSRRDVFTAFPRSRQAASRRQLLVNTPGPRLRTGRALRAVAEYRLNGIILCLKRVMIAIFRADGRQTQTALVLNEIGVAIFHRAGEALTRRSSRLRGLPLRIVAE